MVAFDYGVGSGGVGVVRERADESGVVDGTNLHEFAVEMHYIRASGALVEVVDVLGYHHHVEVFLELVQNLVGTVGLDAGEGGTAFVVEAVHEGRIAREAVGTRHIHYRVLLP